MKQFHEHFLPDRPPSVFATNGTLDALEPVALGLSHFLTTFGGCSFRNGLYRSHTPHSAIQWTKYTADAFPQLENRILSFGYDWLGRQFVIDRLVLFEGQARVLLCDLGFNEILEISASFESFHDIELVERANTALASPFFQQWLDSGGAQPSLTQCIGYRIPLKLGGVDEVSNLELTDMEIYWRVVG